MKILVVDHNAILAADRGLYRALDGMDGLELALVVPLHWKERWGNFYFEREEGNLQVYGSRNFFAGRSHRAIYLSLWNRLEVFHPDVIYVNSEPEGYLAWQAVVLRDLKCKNAKVIFESWRNIDYADGEFPYKLAWTHAMAERSVLSAADHCIVHSESAKEIFSRKGFYNTMVIPPAVDTSLFKKLKDKTISAKLRLKEFAVGYIGRFIDEKGIDVLLQAAKMLEFDYQILLVGDGPAKSRLIELAKALGINDRVVWGGPVPNSEIPAYLNALDVLVLPSRTGRMWKEQFGRILIEAMACGVPVIGSTSGEIPKVIADAGLVFKEEDPHALALGLQQLHSDAHLRSQLSEKGLDRVERLFSLSCISGQYYEVFRSLLPKSNHVP